MAKGFRVKVHRNDFPKLSAQAEAKAMGIIRDAAMAIERGAKTRIAGWPAVDTGALLNSTRARKEQALRWVIAPGVNYGVYVEFGTYKMAARPFLFPAVEAIREQFVQDMKKVAQP